MGDLVLMTYDWVPEPPRGFVRDIRVRWALEEAGLPYRVATTSFDNRGEEHLAHQPFAQVPWLMDGDQSIFESGAILLHLGERSEALMPADPKARMKVVEWVIAALNSVEMASLPWAIFRFFGDGSDTPAWMNDFLKLRLTRMEPVLAEHEWLVDDFSIADILMADTMRVVGNFGALENFPACAAYVARATARPAFAKAYADQMAHFAAADKARAS